MRQVTLVCGPPCGGKTRFVGQHAGTGDVIVCTDRLARDAGSPNAHEHHPRFYDAARPAFQRLVDEVGGRDDVKAWVIRCAPTRHERALLAVRLRATRTVLLVPTLQVALGRAHRSGRDPRIVGAIHHWYRRYEPARGDEVLRDGVPYSAMAVRPAW